MSVLAGGHSIKRHDPADLTPAFSASTDGRFELHGINLRGLIFMAHVSKSIVTPGQIVDGPSWMDSELFDVAAQSDGDPVGPDGYTPRTIAVLQKLIADQFKVNVRPGSRELPAFELVATAANKLGPNLAAFDAGAAAAGARMMMEAGELVDASNPDPTRGIGWQRAVTINDGVATIDVRAKGVTMFEVALHLALSPLSAPVIDRTGLKGKFTITGLRYTQSDTRTVPTDRHGVAVKGARVASAADDAKTLAKALEEQLGLTLRQTKASLDVLQVDAIDRPAALN